MTQAVAPSNSSSPAAVTAPPREVADDLPSTQVTVTVVRDLATLRQWLPAWQRLVETAIEPNVFYEPALLLPALELLHAGRAWEVVLIHAPINKHPDGPRVLCGLFPFERRGGWFRTFARLTLLRYDHCFLCTPLVRADRADETLAALLVWCAGRDGAPFVKFDTLPGQGPLHERLVVQLYERGPAWWISNRHVRAALRPKADAESYIHANIERKRRQELSRLERRLAEEGTLQYVRLRGDDDLTTWLDRFLALESSGWKGRSKSALACAGADEAFFVKAAQEAFLADRLLLHELRLGEQTLAGVCAFLAKDGGYAFKVAFDERYARYSPGALVLLDLTRRLHEKPGPAWFDSCASPDHPLINRMWSERITIESLWIGNGRRGRLLLALAPLARWARDLVRRARRGSKTSTPSTSNEKSP